MSDEKEKWRANYVPAPHFYNLNQACALVQQAFARECVGIFLCGSSITRRDFRDVDVRMMMWDAEFDRFFKDPEAGYLNPLWSLLCTTLSAYLSQQSGLPVDFQIQRMTQANEAHSRKDGHDRQSLGMFRDYPGERPSETKP